MTFFYSGKIFPWCRKGKKSDNPEEERGQDNTSFIPDGYDSKEQPDETNHRKRKARCV